MASRTEARASGPAPRDGAARAGLRSQARETSDRRGSRSRAWAAAAMRDARARARAAGASAACRAAGRSCSAAGSPSPNSTSSRARNGTRTSRLCAIEILSAFISRLSSSIVWKSTYCSRCTGSRPQLARRREQRLVPLRRAVVTVAHQRAALVGGEDVEPGRGSARACRAWTESATFAARRATLKMPSDRDGKPLRHAADALARGQQDRAQVVDDRAPEVARVAAQHLVAALAGQRDLHVLRGAAAEVPERQHRAVGQRLLERVDDRIRDRRGWPGRDRCARSRCRRGARPRRRTGSRRRDPTTRTRSRRSWAARCGGWRTT